MTQTPRELVYRALKFERPARLPRQTGILPWAQQAFPEVVANIYQNYPDDITGAPAPYQPSPRRMLINRHTSYYLKIKPLPKIALTKFCDSTDRLVLSGCLPRPCTSAMGANAISSGNAKRHDGRHDARRRSRKPAEKNPRILLTRIRILGQNPGRRNDVHGRLGIPKSTPDPPAVWRELFKPMYKDYCDLAHAHGKFIFMHSDGYISEIYDDLIEIGVDAINSQLFVMDMADLAKRAKGKITFWGEIDRQHVMTSKDPSVARQAVRKVAQHLYDPTGGINAQF